MILRRAQLADAAAICAIHNPIIRETDITFTTRERTPDEVAAQIAERGAAFQVALIDRQVAGFATYGAFRKGPGYAATREHSVLLADSARRRGVGRALMQRLEQVALGENVHVLVAGISADNPAAIAFHLSIGFDEVGRMPEVGRKGGQWRDLVLMQKVLRRDTAPDTDRAAG